jgi:hypothetical protein
MSYKQKGERNNEESTLQFVVGSLMYAMVCTRPDTDYVVGIVRRFMKHIGLH